MTVRVLVVDDSKFYRHRLCEILTAENNIQVVGTAGDGAQAVQKTLELRPDVITMDYEMPGMDGVTAIREIMKVHPTPVLMFSSLSYEGSRVSNDAMSAGAVGFIAKSFEKISNNNEAANKELASTIIHAARDPEFKQAKSAVHETMASNQPEGVDLEGGSYRSERAIRNKSLQHNSNGERTAKSEPSTSPPSTSPQRRALHGDDLTIESYDLILIGCSTGGPVALRRILEKVDAEFSVPIIVVQHMPDTFTGTFSKRLDQLCKVRVKEARDGDVVEKGVVLVAPGGRQLVIDDQHPSTVRVLDAGGGVPYSPSVDVCFNSVAKVFRGQVLAIVLTGMGSDGLNGVKSLKRNGATVWAQDEDSCVVYGMPMAVTEAKLVDRVLSLREITERMSAH